MKPDSSFFLSLLWFAFGNWVLPGAPLSAEPAADTSEQVLITDLEVDPAKTGWTGFEVWQSGRFEAEWTTAEANSGKRSMKISGGVWASPKFEVRPFNFYRVTFASKTDSPGYWMMEFFDSKGQEMAADDYSNVDVSKQWLKNSFCVMARAGASYARLGFRPMKSGVWIDDISVAPISRGQALEFTDELYRELPPVKFMPEEGRFKALNRTMEKLRSSKELTVVILGDSIANDMANSQFHLLLERNYPGSRIRLIHSVRGITGCWYYEQDNHVESYILDHRPDLVIIAGISHHLNTNAIRSVIRQVRVKQPVVEFLVMTGAIIEPGMHKNWLAKGMTSPPAVVRDKAIVKEAEFYASLCDAAKEDNFATFDMRTVWEEYLNQSGQPRSWFQRDFVHANVRGKQILGRIVTRFFEQERDN
ncbi:MAG: SGNH/GDSL hydrolase family protein [Planctomycetota bacterium]|nr:SGNH/GDSL hydrolase family protein [Planctomycetota bacterium]MDA1142559.1 SGNH/GDSL hydrolase family protein [Planctomycetota bacterium]